MADRRRVQMGSGLTVRKTSATVFASGAAKDCAMFSSAHIPYDYVPPPENIAMATIPYKWPAGDDWSRSWSWDENNYPRK